MRFNWFTNSVVCCQVHDRVVSAWTFSTMRLMLFIDGRHPRYAFPVLAEYISPNVCPRKSNCPSGTLQIRVFSSLTVSSHDLAQAPQGLFGFAPPAQDHEVVGVGHDTRAEASLQPEHLPSQHEPAH